MMEKENVGLLEQLKVWEDAGEPCAEAVRVLLRDASQEACEFIDANGSISFAWAECDVLRTDGRWQRILIPVRTYAIQGGGERAGIWIRSPLCWYHVVSVHPDAQGLLGDAVAAVSMLCRLFTSVHSVESWVDAMAFHAMVRTVFVALTQCDRRWLHFCCEHALRLLGNCNQVQPFLDVFQSEVNLRRVLLDAPAAAEPATLKRPWSHIAARPQQSHLTTSTTDRLLSPAASPCPGVCPRRIPDGLIQKNTQLLNCVFCSGLYDKAHAPQWLDCLRRHVLAEELAIMREHARNLLRLRSILASARVRAFVERELDRSVPGGHVDQLAALRSDMNTHVDELK